MPIALGASAVVSAGADRDIAASRAASMIARTVPIPALGRSSNDEIVSSAKSDQVVSCSPNTVRARAGSQPYGTGWSATSVKAGTRSRIGVCGMAWTPSHQVADSAAVALTSHA